MESCLSCEQGKILEYLCNCVFSCHGAIKFDNSSRSILGMKKRNLGCRLDTRYFLFYFIFLRTHHFSEILLVGNGPRIQIHRFITPHSHLTRCKKHLGDMKFCLWYEHRTNSNSSLSYFWSENNSSGTIVRKL